MLPWPVLAAAVGAGALAATIARVVFPLLSINNDEAVYLLQAEALTHGSLFPRAPHPLSAFIPWLTVARDGHYLPKYTPFFPALLAASKLLTGGTTAALVLVAAAIPVVTYLLAREVTGERRPAIVAALLVAGSPVVVLHTGLRLTYLPTMVLLEAFAWMLLRGVRTRGTRGTRGGQWFAGSGLALSSAAAIRPYDAVLFGLPLIAWALLRRPYRDRVRECFWIAAGGLLPAALLLAYNLKATGSPLRLPFSAVEPLDKLGFGVRKLFPTDRPHHFGPLQGAMGVVGHLRELAVWLAGGALTMLLAGVALWRRRTEKALLAVAGAWVTIPLGYLAFWGPWNASVLWTGTRAFGPFYFIPLLPSLAIFAGLALTDLRITRRRAAAGVAGLIALSSIAVTAVAARTNIRFSEDEQQLQALLDVSGGPQLVFVGLTPPSLMHPSSVISNNWEASGHRVFAVHDSRTDLLVADRLPGRTLLQLTYRPRATPDPKAPMSATLRRLDIVDTPTLPVSLHARLPRPTFRLLLQVNAAGRSTLFDLGPRNKGAMPPIGLTVGGDGTVSISGKQPMEVSSQKTKPQAVVFRLLDSSGSHVKPVASQDLVAAIDGGRLRALVPGASLGAFGPAKPPRLELSVG